MQLLTFSFLFEALMITNAGKGFNDDNNGDSGNNESNHKNNSNNYNKNKNATAFGKFSFCNI